MHHKRWMYRYTPEGKVVVSVPDPWNFGVDPDPDPDPRIHAYD